MSVHLDPELSEGIEYLISLWIIFNLKNSPHAKENIHKNHAWNYALEKSLSFICNVFISWYCTFVVSVVIETKIKVCIMSKFPFLYGILRVIFYCLLIMIIIIFHKKRKETSQIPISWAKCCMFIVYYNNFWWILIIY